MRPPVTASLVLAAALIAAPLFAAETASAPKTVPAGPTSTPPADAPAVAGSKTEQLLAAQRQLAAMKLRHDEKHPAITRQRAKIARLQQEIRAEEKERGPLSPAQQLDAAKAELEELRKKYTDAHPQVQALQRRIAELEQQAKQPRN